MRTYTCVTIAVICLSISTATASAQSLSAERFVTAVTWQTMEEGTPPPTPPKTSDVLILLPTMPLTFTSLQKDAEGSWHLGAAMSAGIGVTFLLGKAEIGNDKRADIFPWLIAGAAINAGLRENVDDEVGQTLALSGFFGIGNVAISVARDMLQSETSFGLSLKLDTLTDLAPDAFMCLSGCPRGQ